MARQLYLRAAVVVVTALAISHRDVNTPARAQSADPCATTRSAERAAPSHVVDGPQTAPPKAAPLDHDDRWSHLDSLWIHRARQARMSAQRAPAGFAADAGDIAILQDSGDLVTTANMFDLRDLGIRLAPNSDGGYDVSRVEYAFRPLGTGMTMNDDDARQLVLPFQFSFFGQQHDHVFLNSDGNLTFSERDVSSADRSVARFLTGAPRVAPLFTDLDPSAGGRVLTRSDANAVTITWCAVPEYGTFRTATVQVTLLRAGSIEIQFSSRTTIRDAIVGVSPGNTTEFLPVDLSANDPIPGGSTAIGERFTSTSDLDAVAVARRFIETHNDTFDNIVIFTDQGLLTGGAFAYEISVSNQIRGLNLPIFDDSAEYGTAGRLQSLCNMDALSKYPDDPRQVFLDENSTVSVMGQEVGHRWLAFFTFRDHTGRTSRALLGRDAAHWSFFFDSDASVLEGNDIEDLGGGSFRTVAAVQRYSLLDQYAMGLVDKSQVPPFFYVQNPFNVPPRLTAASSPEVGATFSGTRRDVSIDDVIAVHGARVPSAADSPRVYRQAFIYIVSAGRTVEPSAIAKLDRIRVAWDQFFSAATDSRMQADTRLSPPT